MKEQRQVQSNINILGMHQTLLIFVILTSFVSLGMSQVVRNSISSNMKHTLVDKVQVMTDSNSLNRTEFTQSFDVLYPATINSSQFKVFGCLADIGLEISQPLLSIQTSINQKNGSSLQITTSSKISLSKFSKIAIVILYWQKQILNPSYLTIDEVYLDLSDHPTISIDYQPDKLIIILNNPTSILSYDFQSQIKAFSFIQSLEMESLNNISNYFDLQLTTQAIDDRTFHIQINSVEDQRGKLKNIKILYLVFNYVLLEGRGGVKISSYSIDSVMSDQNEELFADDILLFNTFYGFSGIIVNNQQKVDMEVQIANCLNTQVNCLKMVSNHHPFYTKLAYLVIKTTYCSYDYPYFLSPNECHLKCPVNYKANISQLTCQCNLFQEINGTKICLANTSNLKMIQNRFYYFSQPIIPIDEVNKDNPSSSQSILLILCGILAIVVVLMIILVIIFIRRKKSEKNTRKRNKVTEQMYTIQNLNEQKSKWIVVQNLNQFKKQIPCLICQRNNTNFQIYCGHQYHLHCFIRHFNGTNKSNCKNKDCNNNSIFHNFGLFFCKKCQHKYCLINFTDKIFKEYEVFGEMMLLSDNLTHCDNCIKILPP